MGLESGTWVEDLVVTNPASSDSKSQGDDHLTLIKRVLKNTFKRTSGRAIYFPTVVNKAVGSFSIATTDDGTIFRCDTSGGNIAIGLLGVALTATDAGFRFSTIKTTADTNPIFIGGGGTPAMVNGFNFIRRTRQYDVTQFMWTGSEWVATRASGHILGEVIDYYGATLPNGFLWCDGASFSAGNYFELNSILGTNVVPDLRGRTSVGRDNMGVGAAGRVTTGGSGVDGTTLKAAGGTETHTLTTAQLATHLHDITHGHGGTTGAQSASHTHTLSGTTDDEAAHTHPVPQGSTAAPGVGAPLFMSASAAQPSISTGTGTPHHHGVAAVIVGDDSAVQHTHTFTNTTSQSPTNSANQGSGTAHLNMQPTLICNKIIVAE